MYPHPKLLTTDILYGSILIEIWAIDFIDIVQKPSAVAEGFSDYLDFLYFLGVFRFFDCLKISMLSVIREIYVNSDQTKRNTKKRIMAPILCSVNIVFSVSSV